MEEKFVATVTYPRVEPRCLAGQCLQGPRTPQKVKRDGYGWTFDLSEAWTFPSKKQAEAKCRIVERHMDWGIGVMNAETLQEFRDYIEERLAANPPARVNVEVQVPGFDAMPPDCQEAMGKMISAAVDAAREGKLQNKDYAARCQDNTPPGNESHG